MDRYKKEFMSGVDVTKRELNDLKEAFKQDKFKELFKEYVDEVNDPKNQALYEKELLQLEKERGVDSTFLRPTPGYVIKTSVENDAVAYINVCYNEKIDKPSSTTCEKNGEMGSNWSLPHVFSKGRMEMNKEGVEALVYDVLFNPRALDLAHRHPEFKQLVNDTAMTAVEDGDRVKLDRRNARIAKTNFVGGKHPCLLRKVAETGKKEDVWEMPGYPYPTLEKDQEPVVKDLGNRRADDGDYTTPTYVVKERKGIDLSEFRLAKDAKMMAAIPQELVISIPLPLLRSAAEATLDVHEKSLTLVSEKPAKYKLEVTLPYYVDDDNGSAQFDKDRKILTVTLPVLRKKYEHDLMREDSGIDSDVTHNEPGNRSSSEEELLSCCNLEDDDVKASGISERFSEEVKDEFLDHTRAYTLPTSTVTMRSDKCFVVLHVKNIDPASVHHQFWGHDGVWVKFSSTGGGMFPTHHAVCLQAPRGLLVDKRSLRIEVWDNNMICSMKFHTSGSHGGESSIRFDKCLIGLDPDHLFEAKVIRETDDVSEDEREDSDDEDDDCRRRRQDGMEGDLSKKMRNSLHLQKECDRGVVDDVFDEGNDTDTSPLDASQIQLSDSEKSPLRERAGTSHISNRSEPERVSEVTAQTQLSVQGVAFKLKEKKDTKNNKVVQPKARTLSESSVPIPQCGKRSILKGSRSLSECHAEDPSVDWSSLESNESPDDPAGSKKTVRFSDVVSKKIFRANSSILGQRKKNEKKSRNRKKAAERRASESEPDTEADDISASASENSEVSDVTDVSAESSDDNSAPVVPTESNKHHRRRGSKNRRKNAASAKQNYLLNRDL